MRLLLAALLAFASACSDSSLPDTVVFVVFDADAELAEQAARLRITTFPEDGPVDEITHDLDEEGLSFPITQPLAPTGGDGSRPFRLEAELQRADGTPLVRQHLRGAFVAGRHRFVRLRFDAACQGAPCSGDTRCIEGACRPACVTPEERADTRTSPQDCGTARRTLTVRSTSDVAIEGFPLLVRIDDEDALRTGTQGDGRDIGFVDRAGIVLDHEIERFDRDAGSLVAWVMLPTLPARANSSIDLVFGGAEMPQNPGRLWADYEAVWHFSEDAGPLREVAVRANAAELSNVERGVQGVVGRAYGFADGARVSVPDDGLDDPFDFDEEESFSFSLWARYASSNESQYQGLIDKFDSALGGGWLSGFPSNDRIDACLRSPEDFFCASTPTDWAEARRWYHIAGIVDRTSETLTLYVDGDEIAAVDARGVNPNASAPGDNQGNTLPFSVGSRNLTGAVDEVRVIRRALHPEEVRMAFENQRPDSAFVQLER